MNIKYIFGQDNKQDEAYKFIAEKIESGEFPEGMLLVERQICATLEMSRTPVRAALSQLAAEGELVTYTPNIGMSVKILGAKDIKEIYELREILDTAAVSRFIKTADDGMILEVERLTKILCSALDDGDNETAARCSAEIHQYFLDHCNNARMSKILLNLLPHVRFLRKSLLRSQSIEENKADLYEFYTEYCKAIKNRDSNSASRLLHEHYEYIAEKQIKLLKEKE